MVIIVEVPFFVYNSKHCVDVLKILTSLSAQFYNQNEIQLENG